MTVFKFPFTDRRARRALRSTRTTQHRRTPVHQDLASPPHSGPPGPRITAAPQIYCLLTSCAPADVPPRNFPCVVLHTTATRWQQEPEYLTPYYPRVDVLYGDLRKTCSSPVHHDGSCETEVNGVVSGQRQWAASGGRGRATAAVVGAESQWSLLLRPLRLGGLDEGTALACWCSRCRTVASSKRKNGAWRRIAGS